MTEAPWTERELAHLRGLQSAAAIAEIVGCSPLTIASGYVGGLAALGLRPILRGTARGVIVHVVSIQAAGTGVPEAALPELEAFAELARAWPPAAPAELGEALRRLWEVTA